MTQQNPPPRPAGPPAAPRPAQPPQWEYTWVSTAETKKVQQLLDEHGKDGWELVTSQYAILHTGTPAYLLWFKRPKRG